MHINKIPELLCPAGSLESVYAAANNGADAVYLGGKAFNARNFANNISDEQIEEVVDYCHQRGVKVHITLNTLYKNSELKDVLSFAGKMAAIGADAFIMQDMGTAMFIKRHFPGIRLHASTQMTAHSSEGVKLLKDVGFHRVVLSRELSYDEIECINDENPDMETEVFIHGALCVCYSGQCLMSSIIGGRSGNRGRCAQPCRLQYALLKGESAVASGHLLSPRDMMTLENLSDIVSLGVGALKIEGRMKSPEYVAIVAKAYREQLDRIAAGDTATDGGSIREVTQIFNRGGSFTPGYFDTYAGAGMMSVETPKSTGLYIGRVVSYEPPQKAGTKGRCLILSEEDLIPGDGIEIWTKTTPHAGAGISKPVKRGERFTIGVTGAIHRGDMVYRSFDKTLADKGKRLYQEGGGRLVIVGEIIAMAGEPLKLTLKKGDISISLTGGVVEPSRNQPMDKDRLVAQFSKTGNTSYTIRFDHVMVDGNIYVPVGEINALRRACMEKFNEQYLASFKRKIHAPQLMVEENPPQTEKKVAAQVESFEQMVAASAAGAQRIYFPSCGMDGDEVAGLIQELRDKGHETEVYIRLPRILRQYDEKRLADFIRQCEPIDVAGYMACTLGELNLLKIHTKKHIVLDYSFNIMNSATHAYYAARGYGCTLSPELSLGELKLMGSEESEIIVHGRQLLMVTHQCPIGLYAGEKESGKFCKLKKEDGHWRDSGYTLKDRKDMTFPIVTDCRECICYLLNGQTLNMLNKFNDIRKTSAGIIRLIFWDESPEQVGEAVSAYGDLAKGGNRVYELPVNSGGVTYGHFFRGVE